MLNTHETASGIAHARHRRKFLPLLPRHVFSVVLILLVSHPTAPTIDTFGGYFQSEQEFGELHFFIISLYFQLVDFEGCSIEISYSSYSGSTALTPACRCTAPVQGRTAATTDVLCTEHIHAKCI